MHYALNFSSVPHQTHEKLSKLIINYIYDLMDKIKSPNKVDINTENPLDPWYENHLHWNYEAANVATKQVIKFDIIKTIFKN